MNTTTRGTSVLASAVLITGATYVAYASGLVTSTLVARGLGPADYGRYAYVVWLWSVLVGLMLNGLTTSAIRFVSESRGLQEPGLPEAMHRWFGRWQWVSIAVVSVGFALALPYLQPSGWSEHLFLFGLVAVLAAVAKARYVFDVSICKGHGAFSVEAWSISLLALANAAGAAVLWAIRAPLIAYLQLFVAVCLLHPLFSWWQMRRLGIRAAVRAPSPDRLERVYPHLYWTMVLALVAVFSNKAAETFLLNRYTSAEAVGFFTIAAALTRGGVDMLSIGLTTVLMPVMAHGFGSGGAARAHQIANDALRSFHFLGLLLVGVGFLWARPIVTVMYGQAYEAVIPVLQVMVVVGGLSLTGGAFGALLSTTDNQRARAVTALFTVAASVVLAFLLVPKFGLSGALWSHASSSLASLVVLAIVVTRAFALQLPWRPLMRLTLAAGAALAATGWVVILSASPWVHLGAGVAYALAFAAATILLRAWLPGDRRLVEPFLRRVPALAAWLERRMPPQARGPDRGG